MSPQQQEEFRRAVEAAKRKGTLLVSAKDAGPSAAVRDARIREQARVRMARMRERNRH